MEVIDILHQAAHNMHAGVLAADGDKLGHVTWDAAVLLEDVRVNVEFKYRLSKEVLRNMIAHGADHGDPVLIVTSYEQWTPDIERQVRNIKMHVPVIFEVAYANIDSVSRSLRRLILQAKNRQ